ncbi:MAG TPA: hypothetical protein VE868_13320, partial [Balneolaceae bacterium]|nr:hypothetical protein [Balneolaceae bacterium]
MKRLAIIFFTIVLSIAATSGLHAQRIDKKRMNRNLATTESILSQYFKTRLEGQGKTSHTLLMGPSSIDGHVIGNYLPDYGVILTIFGTSPGITFDLHGNTTHDQLQFETGQHKKITTQNIIRRLEEFLRDYGSTIGQLKKSDKITIIYQRSNADRLSALSFLSDSTTQSTHSQKLPETICVTAKKSDVDALNHKTISTKQFNARLHIQMIAKDEQKLDLKIMANILKTRFNQTKNRSFQISGSVRPVYINGLGALFYASASSGVSLLDLNKSLSALKKNLYEIKKSDSINLNGLLNKNSKRNTGKLAGQNLKNLTSEENKNKKERMKAYHQFLKQLKETMIDYGQTLKSVQSGEWVYFSVSLSPIASIDRSLPSLINMEVKKSVLDQVNQGK